MAQKRRSGDSMDDLTGREKKKLKMTAARTIAVQTHLQAGPSSQSGVAGPSKRIQFDSLTGLPSSIDLERFVEARAFEIDAMHTAMKTASASSTHRVWQTLPRHLRRRAASHDVRRVPLRLRDRARAEMDPVRKKALGRSIPKRGIARRTTRTDSFLKRIREKSWLETHLWHAKRMHMETLWGYRLAVCPTEKAYRPSHRAAVHDAILHDASYYSLVEVKGAEQILVSMLERFCDPQGPGPSSKRCLGGSRVLETWMYKPGSYPYDLIAPVTVVWKPADSPTATAESDQINAKGKGKAKEPPSVLAENAPSERIRCVWLRFHPSVHTEVLNILQGAASQTLATYKEVHGDSKEMTLEIANLKNHVNVFEIVGPKSSQVIRGALSPVHSDKRGDFLKFWSSLTNLQSAGSVPRGMIIGFTVNDPRLSFPPKNAKAKLAPDQLSIIFPSVRLAASDVWDERVRSGLAKPRYRKKDLDERRSNNGIPGTRLDPLRQDDRIPVLLIQRSLETHDSNDSQSLHGWTLIVPKGWSMAFFSSLVFTTTRVGGQRERQTQSYEAGTPYFPRDYPPSQPYQEWIEEQEAKEKLKWDRKPPAKRVNYEKLGVKNPWRPDWDGLLHTPGSRPATSFVTTQRETTDTGAAESDKNVRRWLLRGSEVPKILSAVSSVLNPGGVLLSEINRLRSKRHHPILPTDIKAVDLLEGALINVKIDMCSRGSPESLCMIYSFTDDLARQWSKTLHARQSAGVSIDEDSPQEAELSTKVPAQDAVIGYVTTGHFSLSRGHGFGIGAISLAHLLELEHQHLRLYPNQKMPSKIPPLLVGIQNTNSLQCRPAHIEVIVDA